MSSLESAKTSELEAAPLHSLHGRIEKALTQLAGVCEQLATSSSKFAYRHGGGLCQFEPTVCHNTSFNNCTSTEKFVSMGAGVPDDTYSKSWDLIRWRGTVAWPDTNPPWVQFKVPFTPLSVASRVNG